VGFEVLGICQDRIKSSASTKSLGYFEGVHIETVSIKIGAEEYLVKSFTDNELFEAVERVLVKRPKSKKNVPKSNSTFGIVGNSAVMQKVLRRFPK
jgi:DNA-binding NtrC family response regulator